MSPIRTARGGVGGRFRNATLASGFVLTTLTALGCGSDDTDSDTPLGPSATQSTTGPQPTDSAGPVPQGNGAGAGNTPSGGGAQSIPGTAGTMPSVPAGVGGSSPGAGGTPGIGGNGMVPVGTGGTPVAVGGTGGEAMVPMVEPDLLDESGPVPTIELPGGTLSLEICTPNIIRVQFSDDPTFFGRSTLATAPKRCEADTPWGLITEADTTTLLTSRLKARVDLTTGTVTFLDAADGELLREVERTLTPVSIQGEDVFSIGQRWAAQDEALYGLGQHQQNLMDIKGAPLSLVQYNTEIIVPFFVSSNGYGVLWDNESWTRWGDRTELTTLSEGGAYQGNFTATTAGEYLFQTWASGGAQLYVDDNLVIDHWRQGWLPTRDYAKVTLSAGQTVALRMDFAPDIGVEIATLSVKPPEPDDDTRLWSEVADGVDYTFVHGPALDDVIAGYRRLTGEAPMMPKWVHGLWQCRERYESAAEVTDVLNEFRTRGIPIDSIVQDWQYWVPGTWGSHDFDTSRFPDPQGWVDAIHDQYNARLMISVWPKFNAGTDSFEELNAAGHLYAINEAEGIMDFTGYPMSYYDAFSEPARAMFWSQMQNDLFDLGIDAWWMDATEPETVEGPYESPEQHRNLYQTHMHPTAMGTGSRMLNAYSLVNSQGVYEGQRAAAPDQRVFILTRSAFAGQQRYASASWSGDISTTWTAFRKQIPAGLNFVLSGIPYWTTDTGGFAEYPSFPGDGTEWEELNTRWFQYSTFVPLLRVHGQDDLTGPREMYNFGTAAFDAHLKFNRLRYRLMPYIYSLAGEVTQRAGTIMRPLVMDFPGQPALHDVWDQYMFGSAFLVSPVTQYQARSRNVVLPASSGGFYDFWTGEAVAGGQSLDADAPYDQMPLFVRAGSIVPMGPELQYTDEVPTDPTVLWVYGGADARFTLYEDDGLSYGYENGEFSEIDLSWDDATATLSVADRRGSYPGMLTERTFIVVRVGPGNPVGFDVDATPAGTELSYAGTAVDVVVP